MDALPNFQSMLLNLQSAQSNINRWGHLCPSVVLHRNMHISTDCFHFYLREKKQSTSHYQICERLEKDAEEIHKIKWVNFLLRIVQQIKHLNWSFHMYCCSAAYIAT